MMRVGHMLVTGYGAKQDSKEAAKWLREAWCAPPGIVTYSCLTRAVLFYFLLFSFIHLFMRYACAFVGTVCCVQLGRYCSIFVYFFGARGTVMYGCHCVHDASLHACCT